jgi:hypothetical protein
VIRNRQNRDTRWLYKGNVAAPSGFTTHGDGVTPGFPLAEAGGLHVVRFDVVVPATAAAAACDWNASYPGQYAPGSHELDLIWYADPLDTAGKLQGKGNLLLMQTTVTQGVGFTGAAQPTQAGGGSMELIVRTLGGAIQPWYYNAALPASAGVITPSSRLPDFVFGTDSGFSPRLTLHINAIGQPIVAGTLRFAMLVAEV